MNGPEPTHAHEHWLKLQARESVQLALSLTEELGEPAESPHQLVDAIYDAFDDVKGHVEDPWFDGWGNLCGEIHLIAAQALRLAAWCHRQQSRGGK